MLFVAVLLLLAGGCILCSMPWSALFASVTAAVIMWTADKELEQEEAIELELVNDDE
jgi:hypothetical protein